MLIINELIIFQVHIKTRIQIYNLPRNAQPNGRFKIEMFVGNNDLILVVERGVHVQKAMSEKPLLKPKH